MSEIFSSGTIKSTQTIHIRCENNDHLKDCKHGQYHSLKVAPFQIYYIQSNFTSNLVSTYIFYAFLGKCHNVYKSANHAFLFAFLNYYSFQLGLLIIRLHFSPCIPCCQTRLLRGNLSEKYHQQRGLWEIFTKRVNFIFQNGNPR